MQSDNLKDNPQPVKELPPPPKIYQPLPVILTKWKTLKQLLKLPERKMLPES